MERKEKTKDAECDGQLSEYDELPEVGNVDSSGQHETENSKYDSQSDIGDSEYGRHEMELENDACDRQPEMRDIECKESSDECLEEVSGTEAVATMSSLFDHLSFDDPNVDEPTDATLSNQI